MYSLVADCISHPLLKNPGSAPETDRQTDRQANGQTQRKTEGMQTILNEGTVNSQ